MTINEAIAYHKKEADECKYLILKEKYLVPQESYYCLRLKENVEIHEQQAEWLEELKTRRETHFDYVSLMDKRYYDGYNKAIDDFVDSLDKHTQENWVEHQEYGMTWSDIERIAEQLKKGGVE